MWFIAFCGGVYVIATHFVRENVRVYFEEQKHEKENRKMEKLALVDELFHNSYHRHLERQIITGKFGEAPENIKNDKEDKLYMDYLERVNKCYKEEQPYDCRYVIMRSMLNK